jgi:hypothetical protein
MKRTVAAIGCVILCLAATSGLARAEFETVKLTGRQYLAVETAVRSLRTKKVSIELYGIAVGGSPGFWIVQFRDPEEDPKRRGGSPRMIEFDVTIRAESYEVVHVQGIK